MAHEVAKHRAFGIRACFKRIYHHMPFGNPNLLNVLMNCPRRTGSTEAGSRSWCGERR